MNLIGIDPSLISSSITINGKMLNYCKESNAFNKSGLQKWYKMAEHLVEYRFINYNTYKNYSEGELVKLMDYDNITDMIIDDIIKNIDKDKSTRVAIEGYSFASNAGDIIDLVTFSTLLRNKIYKNITTDITVLSPSTLKQESCKLTYKPIDIGVKKEKLEWRNNEGLAGGKFTKREMMLSLIENSTLIDDWSKHLRDIKDEVMEMKKIPKPYEDSNDSFLLYLLLKHNRI